jgi:hypothetical protein
MTQALTSKLLLMASHLMHGNAKLKLATAGHCLSASYFPYASHESGAVISKALYPLLKFTAQSFFTFFKFATQPNLLHNLTDLGIIWLPTLNFCERRRNAEILHYIKFNRRHTLIFILFINSQATRHPSFLSSSHTWQQQAHSKTGQSCHYYS